MSDTLAVLVGLLALALNFGPLFMLWWLPGHLEVRELKRRSAARWARFTPQRSGTTDAVRHRHRHRAGMR